MRLLRHLLLFVLAAGSYYAASAQVVSTLQQNALSESFFLYEVKLIDEFIERFNDNPESYIRTQSRALTGTDSMITRPRMLWSLFDKKQHWSHDIDSFINRVCGDDLYLSFADSTWSAQVVCSFTASGKSVKVPVAMRIERENGGLKWVITDAGVDALPPAQKMPLPGKDATDFIPTSAHATNFLYLQYVFASGPPDPGYFYRSALADSNIHKLVSQTSQGKLKFVRVTGVSFLFHQVPGWSFTVEQRKRKDTNSGWLITKLTRTDGH